MIRFIGAIGVGYLVLAMLVMAAVSPSLALPGLGFKAGSLEVTGGWLVYSLVASCVAATAGGFVAMVIAQRLQAVWTLAALVLVLGLVSAVVNLGAEQPALSPEAIEALSAQERVRMAVQPDWFALLLPFIGASGVVLGGVLRDRARRRAG